MTLYKHCLMHLSHDMYIFAPSVILEAMERDRLQKQYSLYKQFFVFKAKSKHNQESFHTDL